MPFVKGNNLGTGRPKGAKNVRTEEWEQFADYCLTEGLRTFREDMLSLDAKDRTDRFLKLLEFHKPKLARHDSEIRNTVLHDFTTEQSLKILELHAKGSDTLISQTAPLGLFSGDVDNIRGANPSEDLSAEA